MELIDISSKSRRIFPKYSRVNEKNTTPEEDLRCGDWKKGWEIRPFLFSELDDHVRRGSGESVRISGVTIASRKDNLLLPSQRQSLCRVAKYFRMTDAFIEEGRIDGAFDLQGIVIAVLQVRVVGQYELGLPKTLHHRGELSGPDTDDTDGGGMIREDDEKFDAEDGLELLEFRRLGLHVLVLTLRTAVQYTTYGHEHEDDCNQHRDYRSFWVFPRM